MSGTSLCRVSSSECCRSAQGIGEAKLCLKNPRNHPSRTGMVSLALGFHRHLLRGFMKGEQAMIKQYMYVFEPKLGLDGTIGDLCQETKQHPGRYSDAALMKVSVLAREYGFPEETWRMPLLEIRRRQSPSLKNESEEATSAKGRYPGSQRFHRHKGNVINQDAAVEAICKVCRDWCDEGVCPKTTALLRLPPVRQDEPPDSSSE